MKPESSVTPELPGVGTASGVAVCSTKFSEHSAAFLHLVTREYPDIPVIWVDTGYNTRDTVQFSHTLAQRLKLNLHVYTPRAHTIRIPPSLDDPEHPDFSREVKIEPFQRALQQLQADTWYSSLRRYQTAHRASLEPRQTLDNGLVKIHPMLEWSERDVLRYLHDNNLPIGPSAFDPTKGDSFSECGLHTRIA